MSNQFLEELKEIKVELCRVGSAYEGLHNKIKEEFLLPELKDRLLTLPQEIKTSQINALNKKSGLGEVEQQMKQREAEISFEINNEIGKNEKPKFSNDTVRKAELTKRLGKDGLYRSLKKEHSEIEFKLWDQDAETDKLHNDFEARKAIVKLVVAELNLYTK